MSLPLSSSERDSGFLAYCLAFAGVVPPANTENMVIAAGYAVGAACRSTSVTPMTVAEVAEAIERMLSSDPPAPAPTADHDPMGERLAGYAEGTRDTLTALAKWRGLISAMMPTSATPVLTDLATFIEERRKDTPKPGMTALEVIGRLEKWNASVDDDRFAEEVIADLRREIEGAR